MRDRGWPVKGFKNEVKEQTFAMRVDGKPVEGLRKEATWFKCVLGKLLFQ